MKFTFSVPFSTRSWILKSEIHNFEEGLSLSKVSYLRFEKGYESLRKWTARIDLFNKKYIIIPINEK